MSTVLARSSVVLVVFAIFSFFIFPVSSLAAISDWQKGASINPQSSTDFSSDSFKQSLRNLAATNANQVTLIIPYYQSNLYTADLNRGWNTPTDESLINAINYAHSLGLKVELKVHPESYTGEWRAYINPTDRQAWFTNYGSILNHYADIGKQTGVEQICIGSEMISLSSDTQNWNNLISGIRQRFSGSLTYSAQHTTPIESQNIQFWNNLDYAGLAAYFPLGDDLQKSWSEWDSQVVYPLYQQWQKPILFTEVGYKSVDGSHTEPAAWWRSGAPNEAEQARSYEALFSYWQDKSYMKGVSFWEWESNPNAGGSGSTSYTPQNKQAETVMTNWFSSTTSPPPTNPPSTPSNNSTQASNYEASATENNLTITSSVKALSDATNNIVDIEIYDGNNQKIFQKFFENQNFSTNQTLTYQVNWTPGGVGKYQIKIGTFSSDWSKNYYWQDNALSLNYTGNTTVPETPPPTTTPEPSLPVNLDIWWPTDNTILSGNQPLKAMLTNMSVNDYKIYWQVDGGSLNEMGNNSADYPHKEIQIDVNSWNWKGDGPYTINFIAKDNNGNTLKETSRTVSVSHF